METDAGKNIHEGDHSYLDLNRAAVPLIEIVSEPDMRSAEEAVAYLKALHAIVVYLGITDGNMEEGSFRCDANVSIRPKGAAEFGTRAELKNLNSFRHVQKAIEYEVSRQQDVLEDGDKVIQETRLFDSVKGVTMSMRDKEEAHDYRYFPDPDLVPVHITDEQLESWKASLPELPAQRRRRFMDEWKLPEQDADIITSDRAQADLFEAAVALYNEPRKIANYMTGPMLREINQTGVELKDSALKPEALAELAKIVDGGLISAKIAQDIFSELYANGVMPEAYVREKGLVQVSDTSAIDAAVAEVIAENPAEAEAYKGGKTKLISFFVGQVMRKMKGKANPALVNEAGKIVEIGAEDWRGRGNPSRRVPSPPNLPLSLPKRSTLSNPRSRFYWIKEPSLRMGEGSFVIFWNKKGEKNEAGSFSKEDLLQGKLRTGIQ